MCHKIAGLMSKSLHTQTFPRVLRVPTCTTHRVPTGSLYNFARRSQVPLHFHCNNVIDPSCFMTTLETHLAATCCNNRQYASSGHRYNNFLKLAKIIHDTVTIDKFNGLHVCLFSSQNILLSLTSVKYCTQEHVQCFSQL